MGSAQHAHTGAGRMILVQSWMIRAGPDGPGGGPDDPGDSAGGGAGPDVRLAVRTFRQGPDDPGWGPDDPASGGRLL